MANTRTTSQAKERADATSAGPQLGELMLVPIDLVDADDRLRAVDPAKSKALAERFRSEPMRSPVLMSGPNEMGRFKLRFGGHRFDAHRINETPEILSRVLPQGAAFDEDDYRLMEIAENVERFELTVLDRAVAIAEWRRIYEARHGKVKRGGDRRSKAAKDQSPPRGLWSEGQIDEAAEVFSGSFSEAAQTAFNLGKNAIFDALKIATLEDVVRSRIAFHRVANSKAELLQLVGETTARRIEIARLLADNPALTVSEAIASIDHLPAPKRPAPVDRVANAFAALKRSEQEVFFELHRPAIELWLAQRKTK